MITQQNNPRGYFTRILVVDCETSGMCFSTDDPSHNPTTGETYQPISWGLIVVDAQSLEVIEKLYVEIKFDSTAYTWAASAEKVHGLSREHLEEHGMDMEDAVVAIAELILRHWGPNSPVCLGGHNVVTFDLWFMRRMLRACGIEIKFANRHIDTNAVGFTVYGTYNSDDLFSTVGLPDRDPSKHNALTDAENAYRVIVGTRRLYEHFIGE